MLLFYILFFTFLGSIISLIGGIILLFKRDLTLKISHLLISFAAGTLLGTAFFDLLPEALDLSEKSTVFSWTLLGMLTFFVLERFIHWFHYHSEEQGTEHGKAEPTIPLIVFGDTLHNFIDGVVIAATFLVSFPLGVITTMAVAAHEIPQEIGDFAILLQKGLSRKKVLIINLLSSASALIGALLMFFMRDSIESTLPIALSITAGFFIYIASSDLIPEIHHEKRKGFAFYETMLLFLGVILVWFLVGALE
ncbi:ZIP family metal transporter [Patescibacteria group bacterium]|nr:ZIP family metal transporter [Patescibacteria group bacterium]